MEINSNEYFSYHVFSGMKLSTTWNGNIIVQSPRKFRDISNTYNIRFIMVYRMIIDVLLHLFINLWCQLPFFLKPSVITEALFLVRYLRCVLVAPMYTHVKDDFETTPAFHVDYIICTTQQVTRDCVPMLANLFNWRVRWPRPARVPLFSLGLKVPRSPCGHSGRLVNSLSHTWG